MKWRDVQRGQTLIVKGERWFVTSRDGDAITMKHPTLGVKTGSPPPDGEVQLAPTAPPPNERPADRTLLRERRPLDARSEKIVQRERRKERVAAENGVAVEAVEQAHVRLTLGATTIAHLKPGEDPQVPKVEVMDEQTMLNHLHFFHDVYPERLSDGLTEEGRLSFLAQVHEEHEATEAHDHSVPF